MEPVGKAAAFLGLDYGSHAPQAAKPITDVLPMAGTTGFDPEAWCPDCQFYKLRRTPKKRSPDEYSY